LGIAAAIKKIQLLKTAYNVRNIKITLERTLLYTEMG